MKKQCPFGVRRKKRGVWDARNGNGEHLLGDMQLLFFFVMTVKLELVELLHEGVHRCRPLYVPFQHMVGALASLGARHPSTKYVHKVRFSPFRPFPE